MSTVAAGGGTRPYAPPEQADVPKPGDGHQRVIAEWMDMDGKPVSMHGWYVGDEKYPYRAKDGGSPWGRYGCRNPKIILDDGMVIWGCECWWRTA